MICTKCKSNRISKVSAKCKDMFHWESDQDSCEGYVSTPGGELGCGDYIEFEYCLECGQIQSEFPVPSKYKTDEI